MTRPDIQPERRGELAKLLRGSPLRPDQIDGYLTAVLIAPEFASPNEWLAPLMEGIEVKGHGSIQRILDILMLRYGALNEAVILGEIGGEVRDLPPKRFQAWTEGFAQAVDGIKGAWPKRALSRDDKQVLNPHIQLLSASTHIRPRMLLSRLIRDNSHCDTLFSFEQWQRRLHTLDAVRHSRLKHTKRIATCSCRNLTG